MSLNSRIQVYVIALRKICDRYSALFLTALQAFIGTIFFAPLAFSQAMPVSITLGGVLALCYLGVFVTLGGYFLYNWGVANMSASTASIYVNMVPVFAILLSYLVLGERFTLPQLGSAALIVVGVLISQINIKRANAEAVSLPQSV